MSPAHNALPFVEEMRPLGRMHVQRVPKDNFPLPNLVRDPLDNLLAQEFLCLGDNCNFKRIQSEKQGIPFQLVGPLGSVITLLALFIKSPRGLPSCSKESVEGRRCQ